MGRSVRLPEAVLSPSTYDAEDACGAGGAEADRERPRAGSDLAGTALTGTPLGTARSPAGEANGAESAKAERWTGVAARPVPAPVAGLRPGVTVLGRTTGTAAVGDAAEVALGSSVRGGAGGAVTGTDHPGAGAATMAGVSRGGAGLTSGTRWTTPGAVVPGMPEFGAEVATGRGGREAAAWGPA